MTDVDAAMPPPNDSARLAESLVSILMRRLGVGPGRRSVIAVAGESGSGKTVTTTSVADALRAAGIRPAVLHQDDYFHLPPRTNHEHRLLTLRHVGPHEVNLDLLQSHIDAFLAGLASVEAPAVDYPANRFVSQRHDFSGVHTLIVEGTYVFQLRGIDARIFLEATHEDTRERRRVRSRDIDAPIIDEILAIEHDIIAQQAAQADIVIDREFAIRFRA